jgi:hypothetical protein
MNNPKENLIDLTSPSIISLPQTKQKVPSRTRENNVNIEKHDKIFNIDVDDNSLCWTILLTD